MKYKSIRQRLAEGQEKDDALNETINHILDCIEDVFGSSIDKMDAPIIVSVFEKTAKHIRHSMKGTPHFNKVVREIKKHCKGE